MRNGKLFLCGGLTKNINYLTQVYIYYPRNDKWYRISDCPQYYCSCAVINDHFTVIGGCSVSDDAITNLLWSYNSAAKKWERLLPPLPTKRSLTTSQVYDDQLIVCGGLLPDKTASDSVEVLDLATKKWSKVQSIPDKLCRQIALYAKTSCIWLVELKIDRWPLQRYTKSIFLASCRARQAVHQCGSLLETLHRVTL